MAKIKICDTYNKPSIDNKFKTNISDEKILHWNYSLPAVKDSYLLDIAELDKDYKCRVLLLNNKNITELPNLNDFPQFSELKVLNLNVNRLTHIDANCIPDSVEHIHLNKNDLNLIPLSAFRRTGMCLFKIIFFTILYLNKRNTFCFQK